MMYLVFGVIIAFGIGSYLYQRKKDRERTEAMIKVAKTLELPFQEENPNLENACEQVSIFKNDRINKIRNIIPIEGEGTRVELFDLRLTQGSGKHSSNHDQTAYRLTLTNSDYKFPEFRMEPEGFMDTVSKWFGGQDINFERYQKFSNDYRLRGENEKAIRTLFNDELLATLQKRRDGLHVEVSRNSLYIYRFEHHADATTKKVQEYVKRYHSIGMAFKKALEADLVV